MSKGKRQVAVAGKKRKTFGVALVIVLVFALIAGGTAAYLWAESGTLANVFSPSQVSCVVENSEDAYWVQNSSDVPAYIRVAVIATWTDSAGNLHWEQPDFTVSCESGWDAETADGFCYYEQAVAADGRTAQITVTPNSTAPDGFTFTVEVLAEAIQSEPTSVVQTKWGVVVSADGTISK